jgi:hypothetical protein
MVVIGSELFNAKFGNIIDPRPRKVLGWLITSDILTGLSLGASALTLVPFGDAKATLVSGLVGTMVIAS